MITGWSRQPGRGGQVAFARLDRAGAKVGGEVLVTTGGIIPSGLDLVSAGTALGLAYVSEDKSPAAPAHVQFAHLNAQGGLTGTPFDVVEESRGPSLAWTGSQYALAYATRVGEQRQVLLSRFDASGAPSGTAVMLSQAAPNADRALIAWTGTRFGVSYPGALDGGKLAGIPPRPSTSPSPACPEDSPAAVASIGDRSLRPR